MMWIDRLNEWIGKGVSWCAPIMIIIMVIDVLMRYLFQITSAASFELEWHLFGAMILLSAAWGIQQDRHVRVDVFYQEWSDQKKAIVNLIGTLLLLLPFCWAGCMQSIKLVTYSWSFRETSPDPGGLPARYLIKAVIPIGFLLSGLQGISVVISSFKVLLSHSKA